MAGRKLDDLESAFVISSAKYPPSRQDHFELAPEVFRNKVLTIDRKNSSQKKGCLEFSLKRESESRKKDHRN